MQCTWGISTSPRKFFTHNWLFLSPYPSISLTCSFPNHLDVFLCLWFFPLSSHKESYVILKCSFLASSKSCICRMQSPSVLKLLWCWLILIGSSLHPGAEIFLGQRWEEPGTVCLCLRFYLRVLICHCVPVFLWTCENGPLMSFLWWVWEEPGQGVSWATNHWGAIVTPHSFVCFGDKLLSHNLTADFFLSLLIEILKPTNSLESDAKFRPVIIIVSHIMHKHLRDESLQDSLPQV